MPELDLTNTAKALIEYDRKPRGGIREPCGVKSDGEFESWQGTTGDDVAKVQLAFYADSDDRNTLEECATIGVVTLRRWVKEWEQKKGKD